MLSRHDRGNKDSFLTREITDDEGNETTRGLGLVVVRGTLLVAISPLDGAEEIANPFLQQQEEDDD
jgi:U6 snRNA-associated Sm-like protein LSm7